jgi:hypothetical protein
MSPVVTQVIADENGEVHSWERMAGQGHRIYQVHDDPTYDLSGTRDQWFLVGDGTAFRQDSWRSTAAFANVGGVRHEIVPVPAEYRQDWLAVSAGDRPVRTFTAPRSSMDTGAMASNVENVTRTHHTAMRHRTYSRRHHPAMTAAHRVTRVSHRSAKPAMAEPAVTAQSTEAVESGVEIRRDQMGHELLQMGSSWYMRDNGDWFRSESWRGPFVHVRKGTVPREVRVSAKHPSRMDMD